MLTKKNSSAKNGRGRMKNERRGIMIMRCISERADTDEISMHNLFPPLLYSTLFFPRKRGIRGEVEVVWRYMGTKNLYVFYGGRGVYYISGWAWPMTSSALEGSSVGLGLDRVGAGWNGDEAEVWRGKGIQIPGGGR